MRYGCCLNMVSSKPDGTGLERLAEAKAAGFDYVELPMAQMMELQADQREAVFQQLQSATLHCEACNNFFPTYYRLTGRNVDMEKHLAYANDALQFGKRLGAKAIVFGSGPAKNVPDDFPVEEGYMQIVTLLQHIGPIAAENGITLAIEPLRKAECNLINTYAEGITLAKDVGHPNVRVLVDYYHLCAENEPVSHIAESGKAYLAHVHFADPKERMFPNARSAGGYTSFFRALHAAGYDGRISCEAYAAADFRKEAKAGCAVLRSLA